MPRYDILLFDLDDTLLDFRANEASALPALFERHGYHFSSQIAAFYHPLNQALWAAHERGELPLQQALNTRFARTMAHFGIQVDGAAWRRNTAPFSPWGTRKWKERWKSASSYAKRIACLSSPMALQAHRSAA